MDHISTKRSIERHRVQKFSGKHPALDISPHSSSLLAKRTSSAPSATLTLSGELQGAHDNAIDEARVILHFDADAFYAQCEELRDPSLRCKPLGITQKFLVVTCNYPARQRGITKLMAIAEAKKKCPDIVLINGEDLTPYRTLSRKMMHVVKRYGPAQKLGLDELFVDITSEVMRRLEGIQSMPLKWCGHVHVVDGCNLVQDNKYRPMDLRVQEYHTKESSTKESMVHKQQNAEMMTVHDSKEERNQSNTFFKDDNNSKGNQSIAAGYKGCHWYAKLQLGSMIAHEARCALRRETGLRTSAGIACNRMLAKLISGLHKPDDQTILFPPSALSFLNPLPVRAISGIGVKLTEQLEHELNVTTVEQLRNISKAALTHHFGEKKASFLFNSSRGIDPSPVIDQGLPKSITVEDSFRGCSGFTAAMQVIKVLVPDLLARLEEESILSDDNSSDTVKHRIPTKFVVKWRHKGAGWSRHSASCDFPLQCVATASQTQAPLAFFSINTTTGQTGKKKEVIHSSQRENLGREEVLSRTAMHLLRSNIAEPFGLSLISLGATNFIDTTVSSLSMKKEPSLKQKESQEVKESAEHIGSAPGTMIQRADQSTMQRRNYGDGNQHISATVLSKRQERHLREYPVLLQQQQQGQQDMFTQARGLTNLYDVHLNHHNETMQYQTEMDGDEDLWTELNRVNHVRENKIPASKRAKLTMDAGKEKKAIHASLCHSKIFTSIDNARCTTMRHIIHCDIDSFYCAVERLDDPSLIGVPLCVQQFNAGGFVAVSYEARAHGIRCGDGAGAQGRASIPHLRAMKAKSIDECKQACPGLIVKTMRPERYREVGKLVLSTLKGYLGDRGVVEMSSCDDFYIDISRDRRDNGMDDTISAIQMANTRQLKSVNVNVVTIYSKESKNMCSVDQLSRMYTSKPASDLSGSLLKGIQLAHALQQNLHEKFPGLTASCGVAANKLLARLVSPMNKPGGISTVLDEHAVNFIRTVPIRSIPSCQAKFGRQVEEFLFAAKKASNGAPVGPGHTAVVADLVIYTEKQLIDEFGDTKGRFLAHICHAIDDSPVAERGPPKSISNERSFPPISSTGNVSTAFMSLIKGVLKRLCDDYREYKRIPNKLLLMWRQGYQEHSQTMRSTSGVVPETVVMLLTGTLDYGLGNCDSGNEIYERCVKEVLHACMDALMLKMSDTKQWNITRLAVGFSFHSTSTSVSMDSSDKQTTISFNNNTFEKKKNGESSNAACTGQTKGTVQQKVVTYQNAEALALKQLDFSREDVIPSSIGISGEERASLEMAIRLQSQEVMHSKKTNLPKKCPKQGPLDALFKRNKRK